MTTNPNIYFQKGCGRCPLFATARCKVQSWQPELAALRAILQETELQEEAKWGVPTYTLDGKNVLILSAFRDYVSISFFKGGAFG